jgi:hypothetical protein
MRIKIDEINLKWNLHVIILEGYSIALDAKMELMVWKIKMLVKVQGSFFHFFSFFEVDIVQ